MPHAVGDTVVAAPKGGVAGSQRGIISAIAAGPPAIATVGYGGPGIGDADIPISELLRLEDSTSDLTGIPSNIIKVKPFPSQEFIVFILTILAAFDDADADKGLVVIGRTVGRNGDLGPPIAIPTGLPDGSTVADLQTLLQFLPNEDWPRF